MNALKRYTTLCMLCAAVLCAGSLAYGEAMLQYFNTDWNEIADKIPELAEAGYNSLWLPPPTKGSGGLSVGYDLWDPLDIGGRDQRSTIRTRYGTEPELQRLIEIAHRFGIRIYFDNIMNHRAFDIPGYNEGTSINIYPGMVPEDFHLRKTEEGFYRKWDNCRDWQSAWQVMNLGLSDLIDIAHETPNDNFGFNEGDDHPKWSGVRHPDNPEFYLDTDLPIPVNYDTYFWNEYTFANKEPWQDVGYTNSSAVYVADAAGNGTFDWEDLDGDGQHDLGEASEPFTDTGLDPTRPYAPWNTAACGYGDGIYNMGNPVVEDVGAYLIRAVRWLMDRTKADGLRLDAVKHVPDYFFGAYNSDTSGDGYTGNAQVQYNLSRGIGDWENHRNSVFSTEIPRDDAMMFGEHLGSPPGYDGYFATGMRLVDNDLRSKLNGVLGNPWAGIEGLQYAGAGGFAADLGVMHAQSHDNDYAACKELQHAIYFTRAGLGLLYTDGNHHAETLGESGGAFPRWANTAFLGQWSDNRIPNLLYIHNQFARGYSWDQSGFWGSGDLIGYERRDWRQYSGNDGYKPACLLMLINDNYADYQYVNDGAAAGMSFDDENAYLYNYAHSDYPASVEYCYASELWTAPHGVPPGGYLAMSWKNPDPSLLWSRAGGSPLTVYENGQVASWMPYVRRDGPDGDPGFNPHGVADSNATDYAYTWWVPRITSGTNISFVARVDGSAGNVLMKLDGGVDLNGTVPEEYNWDVAKRDNPPTKANDVFLGYENVDFVKRIWAEKFAAADSARNKIGSAGAETYVVNIGAGTFSTNECAEPETWNTETVAYVWHSPMGDQDGPRVGNAQFWPRPNTTDTADSTLYLGVKTPKMSGNRLFIYYTTNGTSWPEGAGGTPGNADTHVVEAAWVGDGAPEGESDWWEIQVPPMASGTTFRYKIGAHRQQGYDGNGWDIAWPGGADDITRKLRMMGVWQITNFNGETVGHFPHNDFSTYQTGLTEGFHFIQARAFLGRDDGAAIYNTFNQTFYYDTETPAGLILWPAHNGDSIGGQQYGVVVRGDASTRDLYYHIDDSDPENDDYVTGIANGNGRGFEPFEDQNDNETYDLGEPFTDINENGVYDALLPEAWQTAYAQSQYLPGADGFEKEWRFNYVNIPAGGTNAVIKARLCEWSSAARSTWATNTTDEAGHFTTLERQVYTWGPDVRLFVAWPQKDGDEVGAGYGMKACFSKSLADGLDDAALIDRLTVRIQSTVSGVTTGGVIQSKSEYSIVRDETSDYHALAYTLPNLYNGQTDWLHGIEVTFDREGLGDLVGTRLVKAQKAEEAPDLEVVEPKEYDSDGRRIDLILPDVASPTPEDRAMRIRLRTVTNAVSSSITMNQWPAAYAGSISLVSNWTETGVQFIDYAWSNMVPGYFHFTARIQTASGASNSAGRNCYVILRQTVAASTNSLDDDDDGILDLDEVTALALTNAVSSPNSDLWKQSEIFKYYSYGKSSATSPDTDGDGLHDALELGWRAPTDISQTDTNTDTNGDGWPNFLADLDPPFYNTVGSEYGEEPYSNYGRVPGADSISKGGDRTKKLAGTTTDPTNPDSDYDGLPDGIEDANRNGWVDGDGASIPPDWNPWLGRDWPDGVIDPGETWLETDPNNADTDDDGLSDGNGEDKNFNGFVDIGLVDGSGNVTGTLANASVPKTGGAYSRVIDRTALFAAYPNAAYLETDPLLWDTDGDGMPDGWEVWNNLDPLDSGTVSLRGTDPNPLLGPAGDPDEDGFTNLQEFANGTNPWVADTGVPPPPGTIVIGRGEPIGVINGVTNYVEFTDWTEDDLIALDDYNTEAQNSAVDIYRAWDGYDTSRDMTAFYMHDGGSTASGGDGNLYFRVDIHDLQANAEDGFLNIYVVIDTGNTSAGERNLPDDVDTGTDMRWEAVVAVYGYNDGRVYVDTDTAHNTTAIAQNLSEYGVVARDQNTANGFKLAHFNAELDAVEFSISRQALIDASWNGLDYRQLNFQVYTTKDGTSNDPVGEGDIGGRSDLRDAIRNSWICSDYWRDQDWIMQNGYLNQWVGHNADNDRGKCAKVALLMHGNQHVQPGNVMQSLINNGSGAGLHRTLNVHDIYQSKLNLHITPTFASALQWAKTDPDHPDAWRRTRYADGPEFNNWIRELAATGTVHLLASTFSDHILPFFTADFNNDNAELAAEFLTSLYGVEFNTNSVFWTPERVLDHDVLSKILSMGYRSTIIDQNSHMWFWLGRSTALGDDGYRINKINDVSCFVINNSVDQYKYSVHDGGIAMALRGLFNRRARSGTQDQVVTMFYMWEDSASVDNAAAYDSILRWFANRPWTRIVALDDILAGNEDVSGDGEGDAWYQIDRGTETRTKLGHDWINHATQMNYDNWYCGSAQEEGLEEKIFNIRSGVPVPQAYGMLYSGGIISNAWDAVQSIANTQVAALARSVIHASVFETAFHTEDNNNLDKFSTGEYIYPATDPGALIDFAKIAQSQSRFAALYTFVDAWAAAAPGLAGTQRQTADVDLDGENEYLLYNRYVCALFERSGGRMTAAWTRHTNGAVYQVVGNPVNYAGTDLEDEGIYNVTSNGVLGAYRTSCLKDWWANSSDYVNGLYTITASGDNAWQLASADGKITKTVTLGDATNAFEVAYALSGDLAGQTIYIRNGLSPNLMNLLMKGQTYLTRSAETDGVLTLSNRDGVTDVIAGIGVSNGTHNASINESAVDDNPGAGVEFHTLNMRNLAQIEQVELAGTGSFSFSLFFSAAPQTGADSDQDGIPDQWELENFGDLSSVSATSDWDGDGFKDRNEYFAGTNPKDPNDLLEIGSMESLVTGNFMVRFPTKSGKSYFISYNNGSLVTSAWQRATTTISGTGGIVEWQDNGEHTDPAPTTLNQRTYRIEVNTEE